MNYRTALSNISNVKISNGSPRQNGEVAVRSEWTEVQMPFGFAERVSLITKLANENSNVALKTATGYGRARLFVRK